MNCRCAGCQGVSNREGCATGRASALRAAAPRRDRDGATDRGADRQGCAALRRGARGRAPHSAPIAVPDDERPACLRLRCGASVVPAPLRFASLRRPAAVAAPAPPSPTAVTTVPPRA